MLLQEANAFDPLHYYLAQIACEIRRSWVNKAAKKKLKFADFLIKFTRKTRAKAVLTEADKKAHIQNSKNAWMMAAGFGKPSTSKKRKKK